MDRHVSFWTRLCKYRCLHGNKLTENSTPIKLAYMKYSDNLESKRGSGHFVFNLNFRTFWLNGDGSTTTLTCAFKVPMKWKIEVLKIRCIWKTFKSEEEWYFHFFISHIVPEIFTIFVLCKLGTDDVIRCDSMKVKTQNREYFCK